MSVIAEDKTIRVEMLRPGGDQWANSYLVTCRQTNEAVLIDAPIKADWMLGQVKGTKVSYILLTHNHLDHTSALPEIKELLNVPVAGHEKDAAKFPIPLDIKLGDEHKIIFGKLEVTALHTPGHTPGSMCFRVGHFLFSGDTLFPHGPGHTNSPADFKRIIKSLSEKIFTLPDDTFVFSGHGDASVLGKEKEEFKVFSSRRHPLNLSGDVLWLVSK
ncbi:MAG TPA: MBL fold metallo-hydrolase [Dehalococcoidales bacterium]|nr:MBL fold metallo-hydrolase [Dehalococcoidales bacterium]